MHLFDGEPLEVHADLLPNLHELLDWLGPGVVRVRLDGKPEALLPIYIHLACTVLDGINKKKVVCRPIKGIRGWQRLRDSLDFKKVEIWPRGDSVILCHSESEKRQMKQIYIK